MKKQIKSPPTPIESAERALARAVQAYQSEPSKARLLALKRAAWEVPRDTAFSLAVVAFIAGGDVARKMSTDRLRDVMEGEG